MAGPLSGIKLVEFAGIGPGPFCGMILADLGALDASYDDTLDASAMAADYSNVSLKKTVMEGDLKVEYQRQFDNEGGWNYKKTTYQEDGTYTEECKGSADAEWGACES